MYFRFSFVVEADDEFEGLSKVRGTIHNLEPEQIETSEDGNFED